MRNEEIEKKAIPIILILFFFIFGELEVFLKSKAIQSRQKETGSVLLATLKDNSLIYYDPKDINWTTDNIAEIWIRMILGEENKEKSISFLIQQGVPSEKAEKLYEKKELYGIDIKNKKIKDMEDVYYTQQKEIIYVFKFPDNASNWRDIIPHTIGELLYRLCKSKKEQKE